MEQHNEDFLTSETELHIDRSNSESLVEASKWAKFISVTFFVLTGLLLLLFIIYGKEIMYTLSFYSGLVSGDRDAVFAGAIIGLILVVGLVFVTYYFLLNFANKTKAGVEGENIDLVNKGLKSLKVHFIIIGIMLMLMLALSLYGMLGR